MGNDFDIGITELIWLNLTLCKFVFCFFKFFDPLTNGPIFKRNTHSCKLEEIVLLLCKIKFSEGEGARLKGQWFCVLGNFKGFYILQ